MIFVNLRSLLNLFKSVIKANVQIISCGSFTSKVVVPAEPIFRIKQCGHEDVIL